MKETHFDAVDKTVRRLETIRRRVERGLWTLSALRFLSFAAAAGGALGSAALGYAFRFSLLAALPGLGLFVFFFFLYYKRRDAGSEVRNLIHHRQGDLLRDQPGWWKDNSTPAWPAPENHPYASDLHMTGQFSIGRLLDRTTVPGARAVLYDLLLNQPDKAALDPDEWRKRRDAVHELSRRKVWQSRMRRAGSAERSSRIFEESEDTPVPHVPKPPVLLVVLAWTLPVITIATWIGIQYDALPAWYLLTYPAQLALFAYGMFRYKAAGALYYARADIYADYARVFRAAAFPFQSAALLDDLFQKDQAHLAAGRLAWVATLFAVRRNPILYFLAGSVFLLEIHAAWAAARWEERYAMDFPKWVQEVRRLDAWMRTELRVPAGPRHHVPERCRRLGAVRFLVLC
ncbi:MAG: hypothetical protein HY042_02265 [Spirochaetia bacterium]|nr:hypothetical protein [Spirochaetia bacterium]